MIKLKNKKIKPSSREWVSRHLRDKYVSKAKSHGYKSRSAYKLLEIDKKFNIFNKRKLFLDLGSAPGGWTQVAIENINNGKILSVDILKMDSIDNSHFILGDFRDDKIKEEIKKYFNAKLDIIVSDMAQNTTGNKNIDSLNTGNLVEEVLIFSKTMIKNNGILIFKIFMGSAFKNILIETKKIYKEVKIFKPNASRVDSKENYIICKNLK